MIDKGQILNEAIQVINGERQDQYGDPEDSFSLIADYWQVYLRNMLLDKSENQRTEDVLFGDFLKSNDVAMLMVLFKIAREHYQGKRDNVVDAAGYLGIYGDKYDVDESCFVESEQDPDNEEWENSGDVMGEKEEAEWIEKAKQGAVEGWKGPKICSRCGGFGTKTWPDNTVSTCLNCKGIGYVN